ncbi:hypothetical protein LYNGBM3L_47320 [Moorena producens 3L]|uniref:Uncharacterized protein n=2 Tax=Moorena TaxID=1155738 RepID=F4XQE9_9CYAN|nr:hypothetical protein LYNGBM3L_47320 [Moorena producens 3L]OLT56277.1 hypothetical protein BI334_32360 [Moorena producens 3L]
MGLYLLQRPCEYRHDWLYIADLTLELGAHKCLVVLGISQARWKQIVEQSAGKLCYQDLSLLALKVMKSTKGDLIYPILEAVGDQVGVPLQLSQTKAVISIRAFAYTIKLILLCR